MRQYAADAYGAEVFAHVYSPEHAVLTPMAPELGLYLDEAMYTGYSAHRADTHEPVTLEPHAEEVAAFKAAHIYPHIVRTEAQEHTVANWLRELNTRNLNFQAKPVRATDHPLDPSSGLRMSGAELCGVWCGCGCAVRWQISQAPPNKLPPGAECAQKVGQFETVRIGGNGLQGPLSRA